MGKLFTITNAVRQVVANALDDFITELGKECQLVYPGKWTPCANCVADPIGNKSSNFWRHGGPAPFPNGTTCPMCNGQGRREEEQTEILTFSCDWQPKPFQFPIANARVRVAASRLTTKGFIADLPKVRKAAYLIFDVPVAGYGRKRFELASDPGDPSSIVQGRYFECDWGQVS